MNIEIGRNLYKSLKSKYESEIQGNKTTLQIYFSNPVAIGEHPQHLEEMDKMMENIANAQDKLDELLRNFG